MWGSQGSAGAGTALVARGSLSKLDSRRDALRKSCARMGWRRVGTWNGEPELAAVTYLGVSGRISCDESTRARSWAETRMA